MKYLPPVQLKRKSCFAYPRIPCLHDIRGKRLASAEMLFMRHPVINAVLRVLPEYIPLNN